MLATIPSPIIPTLCPGAYICEVLDYTPSLPHELTYKQITNGDFLYQWVVQGPHTVIARGTISNTAECVIDGDVSYFPLSLHVECSTCSAKQGEVSKSNTNKPRPVVCMHAAVALDSALDHNSSLKAGVLRQKHIDAELKRNEDAKRELEKSKLEKAQAESQKRAKPDRRAVELKRRGDLARIEYGLTKTTMGKVVALLKAHAETDEGLESLNQIFPESVFPKVKVNRCGRCNSLYDPCRLSERTCREEHPESEWEHGHAVCWKRCIRCDKTHSFDEAKSGDYDEVDRNGNQVFDQGKYCYQAEHEPDFSYFKLHDEVIQELFEEAGILDLCKRCDEEWDYCDLADHECCSQRHTFASEYEEKMGSSWKKCVNCDTRVEVGLSSSDEDDGPFNQGAYYCFKVNHVSQFDEGYDEKKDPALLKAK